MRAETMHANAALAEPPSAPSDGAASVGPIVGGLALVVLVAGGVLWMRARGPAAIPKLLAERRYLEAAEIAEKHGRIAEAIDYFVRGGHVLRAARMAAQSGKPQTAAEYYLAAGDFERAAQQFVQAGQPEQASRARAQVKRASQAPPSLRARASQAMTEPPKNPEQAFREAFVASTNRLADLERLEPLARRAADWLVNAGEVAKAAAVYRDAGLVDEAVHLYVNALGAPAEAAPLISARGNHARAAELYELAGDKERAAIEWTDVARNSPTPEATLAKIQALAPGIALKFLEEITKAKPIDATSAGLHYALAAQLNERGDAAAALKVLLDIRVHLTNYRDIADRIRELERSAPARSLEYAQTEVQLHDSDGDLTRDEVERLVAETSDIEAKSNRPDDQRVEQLLRSSTLPAIAPPSAPKAPAQASSTPTIVAPGGIRRDLESAPGTLPTGAPGQDPALLATVLASASASSDPALVATQLAQTSRVVDPANVETLIVPSSQKPPAPSLAMPTAARMTLPATGDAGQPISSSSAPTGRRSSSPPPAGRATSSMPPPTGRTDPKLLSDSAVRTARGVPIAAIERVVAGRACTSETIALYYQLGVACLASGAWNRADSELEKVERVDPSYRDAALRRRAILQWRQTMAGGSGQSIGGESSRPARVFGRYEVLGELGRGGMAIVYRARDTVLGRDVALKFLSDTLSAHPEAREMFEREARSVAQLNHPNIITIYDFGILEDRAFIAMEYVDGMTIDSVIDEQRKLSVIEAMRVTRQVLEALEYAHSRQVIHRDIKPSNIMRSTVGLVKLMDFGLAKTVEEDHLSSRIAGTPAYMPVEQMLGGKVDHRTDLYAVGMSMYQMLTGVLPYGPEARLQQKSTATSARTFDPTIPAAVDAIVLRAIRNDPDARFQSASAFLAPVKKVLDLVDRVAASRGIATGRA